MGRSGLMALCSALSVFLISSSAFAQPTEESLIQAWEAIQKKDPQIATFEKIEERRYKFKTKRFPFDGELNVLNVSIDEFNAFGEEGCTMGVVEVELVGLPDDFMTKYAYSYSTWSQNNCLYYDDKTGKWLSSKEYFAKTVEKLKKREPLSEALQNISEYVPYITIIMVVTAFLIITLKKNQGYIDEYRKYMNESKKYAEVSLEIAKKSAETAEDNNRLLKEILEALKSRSI